MGACASRTLQRQLWGWVRVSELGNIHKSELLEFVSSDSLWLNTDNLAQTRKLMSDIDRFAEDRLGDKDVGFLFAGWSPEKLELVYEKLQGMQREDFQTLKRKRSQAMKKKRLLKAVFQAFDPLTTGFIGSNVVKLLANQEGMSQVRSSTLKKRIAATTHGSDVCFSQFVHCFATWEFLEVANLHKNLDLNATVSLSLTQTGHGLAKKGRASRGSTSSGKNFNDTKVFRDQHEFAMAFEEFIEFKKHEHKLRTHEHTLALKRKTEAKAQRSQKKVAEQKLNQRKERSQALQRLMTQEKEATERKVRDDLRVRQQKASTLQNRELQLRARDEERKALCNDSMRKTYSNALGVVMQGDAHPTAQEIKLLDSLQERHNISRKDENTIMRKLNDSSFS
jgi:hypothetical protein